MAVKKLNYCELSRTPAVNTCSAETNEVGNCVHVDHDGKGEAHCFWRIEGEHSTLCISPDAEKTAIQ